MFETVTGRLAPPYTNRWGCVPGPTYRQCEGTTRFGVRCRRGAMWNSNCCEAHHIGPLWQADYSEIEQRVLAHFARNEMIVDEMKRDFVNDFLVECQNKSLLVVGTDLGDFNARALVNDLKENGKDAAAYALAATVVMLRQRENAWRARAKDVLHLTDALKKAEKKLKKKKRR